jgi:hypothetical protein
MAPIARRAGPPPPGDDPGERLVDRLVAALREEQTQPPELSAADVRVIAERIAQASMAEIKRAAWWERARSIALVAAGTVAFGGAMLGGGYWWASSAAAARYAALEEEYINLPAEFNVVMANHDAERWLDLMRRNTQKGALDHCVDAGVQPSGGKACSYVLWTELPPPK